jgi:hypothetical protein
MVVFEEAAEPFMTMNKTSVPLALVRRRQEDHIALALVRALLVKMGHVLCERVPEGALPKQAESRQGLPP